MLHNSYRNLATPEGIEEWVKESIRECRSSYPMVQTRLPVAVDIGANVGGFCVHASAFFEQIYAFEPLRDNYNILTRVLEQLEIRNVQTYNMAVYGTSALDLPLKSHKEGHSKDISCADLEQDKYGFVELEEGCKTVSLKDILETLQLPRINYLKLDCEGSEYEILENFDDYEKVSIIVMEIHTFFGQERKRRLLKRLQKFYHISPLAPAGALELHSLSNPITVRELEQETNLFLVNRKIT